MIPSVMSSPELLLATTTGATKNSNSNSTKSLGLARVASRKKSTPFAFLDSTSSTTRWRRSGDRISKKKALQVFALSWFWCFTLAIISGTRYQEFLSRPIVFAQIDLARYHMLLLSLQTASLQNPDQQVTADICCNVVGAKFMQF